MAKANITIRLRTKWWARLLIWSLPVASHVLPRRTTSYLVDAICERGTYTETANA